MADSWMESASRQQSRNRDGEATTETTPLLINTRCDEGVNRKSSEVVLSAADSGYGSGLSSPSKPSSLANVDLDRIDKNDDGLIDQDFDNASFAIEARMLFRAAVPLVCTYLLQYVHQMVVVLVASQLSTEEMAGVSLGITTSNILGYALFEGMATALDTLCSQSFGAQRLTDVGMHTIRWILFIHIVAIPVGLGWLYAEDLLLLAGVPDKALAAHAGNFLSYGVIGLPGYAIFEGGKRFMQAQNNFTAGFWVLILSVPLNIVLTYVLVYTADMRVAGAALAGAIANLARPLILIGYASVANRSTLQCWPSRKEIQLGWNRDWKTMMKLSCSGAVMTLAEWLSFEILVFATSFLGTAALAAQTFMSTAASLVWHIPFSVAIACSTRIGQLLGAGAHHATVRAMKWYAEVFVVVGIIGAIMGTCLTQFFLGALIHDVEVAYIVRRTLPYMTIFVFFSATANWPHSIVRGSGRQSIGAWVTVSINYVYAVPLALYLEARWGLPGLWSALASAMMLITVVEAIVIWSKLRTVVKSVDVVRRDDDDDVVHE